MDVQRQLKDFSWFSAVDVSVADRGCIKLTEVDLLERLKRSLIGNKDREKASQDALLKLSEINPAIRLALGTSILDEKSWSASELRSKLKLPADRLIIDEVTGKFHIPQDHAVGLANIRAEESDANMLLRWKIIPKNGADTRPVPGKINVADNRVNQFAVTAGPDEAELRKIYLDVLRDALVDDCSHVTLSPIPDQIDSDDYDQIFHQAFSETSIRCLLEAIDSIKLSHPSALRVTITTDRIPGLADKIKDIQSQRRFGSAANPSADTSVAAMPPALKALAPGLSHVPKADSIFNLGGIEKIKEFDGVRLYWGDPHRLAAQTMILQFEGLHAASARLAGQGSSQFVRIHDMVFDEQRLLGTEAKQVTADARKKWGIDALEIPACEIDTSRLFGMSLPKDGRITVEESKNFFLEHLRASKGRIVIDLPDKEEARNGLLEAIRAFKQSDSGRNSEIVLATGDEKIYRQMTDRANPSRSAQTTTIVKPAAGLKKVPAQAGIHFLKHSPLNLQADRVIIPASLAKSGRFEFFTEKDAVLPRNSQSGEFIGFDDEFMNNSTVSSPKKIQERFSQLLQNIDGTIVISPPDFDEDQLDAVVLAAHEACETNQQLSVSFATEKKSMRDELTSAYARLRQKIEEDRELGIDSDDDEGIITADRLWKSAE
jgi:hypothetical protein